jgi:hypothetical protein
MPALPTTSDTLQVLASKTGQRVTTASAGLRKALARLVSNGGNPLGSERHTR